MAADVHVCDAAVVQQNFNAQILSRCGATARESIVDFSDIRLLVFHYHSILPYRDKSSKTVIFNFLLKMDTNHLTLAKERLDTNYAKGSIPGREKESRELFGFLEERLKIRHTTGEKRARVESGLVADIKGRHMNKTTFICGVPGTGKTATVLSVIQKLEGLLRHKNPRIHKFKHAYINAQLLTSAVKVYSEILLKLTNETCGPEEAQERLESLFTSKAYYPTKAKRRKTARKTARKISDHYYVVIVDELDLLYNDRRQNVFYNLFDWPTSSDSRMIFIAIANAMDLPERSMRARVTSRIGWNKIVFESYTYENLKTIIRTRLGTELQNQCFDTTAIAIACMRIGKTTGDARRILDTCRLAIDYALENKCPKVTSKIIDLVGFQNLDAQRHDYVSNCGPLELVLLKCIIQQIEQVGDENLEASGVYKRVHYMLKKHHFFQNYILCQDKYGSLLHSLSAYGLIQLEADKPLANKKISLVETSDWNKDLIRTEQIRT